MMTGGNYDYIYSEESREKNRQSHLGKHDGEKNPMYGKKGKLNPNYGRVHSEEELQKMRDKWSYEKSAQFGEKNGMYGKHHSEDTKKKQSEKAKARKGKIFVNNGIIAKLVFPDAIPAGFTKGRLNKTEK